MRNAFLAAIVMISTLWANPAVSQYTDFGLKLGINLASFTGQDAGDRDKKTGLLTGVYFEKKIGSAATFCTELLYSQKGNLSVESFDNIDVDVTRKIDYLDIPLIIKIHPPEIKPLNIFVIGGLNPSFKLSGKIFYKRSGVNITEDIDNLKVFDLGYVIGWGFFWARGTHRTTFEMRFVQSLDSIYSNNQFLDIKNSTITFMLGTNFRQII